MKWRLGHTLLLLLALALAALAVVAWPPGPRLGGRTMTPWTQAVSGSRGQETVQAIAELGTNALPTLLKDLNARDVGLKRELAGASAAQPWLGRLFTFAGERRARAINAFQVLGASAESAIPALVRSLNDGETASAAAEALACIGLEGLVAMTNVVSNPDGRVRTAILQTLGRCARSFEENGRQEADTPARPEFESAAKALAPMLLTYLQDENSDVRAQAAEVLGAFHAEPESAVPALAKLLHDQELPPRHAAASALGEYGIQAKTALPMLKRYAQEAGNSERENAQAALKRVEDESASDRDARSQFPSH